MQDLSVHGTDPIQERCARPYTDFTGPTRQDELDHAGIGDLSALNYLNHEVGMTCT